MFNVIVVMSLLASGPSLPTPAPRSALTLDSTFMLRPPAAPAKPPRLDFLAPRPLTFDRSAAPAPARPPARRIDLAAAPDTLPMMPRVPLLEYHDGRVLDWRPDQAAPLRPQINANGELVAPLGVDGASWTFAIGRCPITGR